MKKKVHYTPDSNKTYLHPGRQANIIYEGKWSDILEKYIRSLLIIMESETELMLQ